MIDKIRVCMISVSLFLFYFSRCVSVLLHLFIPFQVRVTKVTNISWRALFVLCICHNGSPAWKSSFLVTIRFYKLEEQCTIFPKLSVSKIIYWNSLVWAPYGLDFSFWMLWFRHKPFNATQFSFECLIYQNLYYLAFGIKEILLLASISWILCLVIFIGRFYSISTKMLSR